MQHVSCSCGLVKIKPLFGKLHATLGFGTGCFRCRSSISTALSRRDWLSSVQGKNHDGLESSRTRKKGNLDYATGLQIAASKQRKKKKPPHLFSKDATNHKSATKLISRDLQSIDGGPMELIHPCLHDGYRKLHQNGQRGESQPASSVVLIGR